MSYILNPSITLRALKQASALEGAEAGAKFLSKVGQKKFWTGRAKDVVAGTAVGLPLYGAEKMRENYVKNKVQKNKMVKSASDDISNHPCF